MSPYPSRDRALRQIARHRAPDPLTPEQLRMAQGARKALALAGAATRPLMDAVRPVQISLGLEATSCGVHSSVLRAARYRAGMRV
ncbi:hypothetical protein ACFRKB_11390 [Streptomyces scopuliridis]|uniref:hypothetical protein n=1 Tax=Streptomyces scopuliridis TaxID=452529 RepID=UPI00368B9877